MDSTVVISPDVKVVEENQTSKATKNGSSVKSVAAKNRESNFSGRRLKLKKRMRLQPESVKFDNKDAPSHEYYKELLDDEAKSEIIIPRAISVSDRVESSVKEMKAMLRAVSQHTSNRAVLQKIPRHMRRRASSHNRKRLPRRLHQLAEEMSANVQADGAEKMKKPPNRKKRRRKSDLQNEYSKRAGKSGWLETHMWHAKRFHMSQSDDPKFEKWGNRVALYPNDKSFRACHRAVAKHCLIQDISYMRCLSLSGSKEELVCLFEDVCDSNFDAAVLKGRKEIEVIISDAKEIDDHGRKIVECIGPALVLCKSTATYDQQFDILMWIHPIILSSCQKVLESCCGRNSLKIEIRDLSEDLLRFRLTGPKSSVTLLSILRPMDEFDVPNDTGNSLSKWMFENKDTISRLHQEFVAFATDCHRQTFARPESASPCNEIHECSDGGVFPIITNDPRLILPLNKSTPSLTEVRNNLVEDGACAEDGKSSENLATEQETACLSPLWIKGIRQQVSESRKPDHIVSTRKCEQKYKVDEGEKEILKKALATAIPIIAICKAPNEDSKLDVSEVSVKHPHSGPSKLFASGWDLVLPKKWATAFWVPLVYSRARAGGLRENRNSHLEILKPHFPEDFPDTIAGKEYWNAEANCVAVKHYRRPPAKRTNYSVLAVPSPFQPNWNCLFDQALKEESTEENKEVEEPPFKRRRGSLSLEDQSQSLSVGETCVNKPEEKQEGNRYDMVPVLRSCCQLLSLQQWLRKVIEPPTETVSKLDDLKVPNLHLVCVGVHALSKGVPMPCTVICAPTSEDIDNLCEELIDPYKYGLQSVTGPEEDKHCDPDKKRRKEERKQVKANKKKKKVLTSDEVTVTSGKSGSNSQLEKPQCFSVWPTREVIGYVTSGDFVFSYARGAGVGFVKLEELKALALRQAQNEKLKSVLAKHASKAALLNGFPNAPLLALTRNINSLQYRFARVEIIKPS